jgi:hypothetical protein
MRKELAHHLAVELATFMIVGRIENSMPTAIRLPHDRGENR